MEDVEEPRGGKRKGDEAGLAGPSQPKNRRLSRFWRNLVGGGASSTPPNAPSTRRRQLSEMPVADEPDTFLEGNDWPETVDGKLDLDF